MQHQSGWGRLELTGRTRAHVRLLAGSPVMLHRSVMSPFLRMRAAAARAGIDLWPASGFRDFEVQVRIWNEKWRGDRPLLDRAGRRLNPADLTPARRIAAILAWSAPPGASRHHWGTDLDVFDRAAVPAGYRLGLVPAEYGPDGPFAGLTAWLDAHMGRFGFYRPYRTDRGGVAPEAWHISHWPTAREASRRLRLATLRDAIEDAELDGKAALRRQLPRIYQRFVRSVDPAPAAGSRSRRRA